MRLLPPLIYALTVLLWALSAPELPLALVGVPALFWAPGAALSLGAGTGLTLGLGLGMLGVVIERWVPGGVMLPAGAALGVAAWRGLGAGTGLGAGSVVVAVGVLGFWGHVNRPLERYWWSEAAEELQEVREMQAPTGFEAEPIGRAWVIRGSGNIDAGLMVVCGPVGKEVAGLVIESDPVVMTDEGAVPRYLERGCASGMVEAQQLALGEDLVGYVMGDAQGLWELHGEGVLRFGHYYQLLNMVEQLRWARELGETRWVTDVQPPMWSWILAVPLRLTGGAQVTVNVLFLWVLAVGFGAYRSAGGAWAGVLGALALVQHARMMLEPGSAGLPDSLFAVAACAAAVSGKARWGVAAQLLRYPGTLLASLNFALAGRWDALARLWGGVTVLMAAFGIYGLVSGQLGDWLGTVMYETGPEHWHGESDPAVLLGRVPEFYGLWAGYSGGALILAVLSITRKTAPLIGSALLYSLLLCTIDHFPSHYFLPLLHLSVLALALSKARFAWMWRCCGIIGLTWAILAQPITG